jgi:hypothetical protein
MAPRRLVVAVLLVVLSTTCRATPGVRLDTGQGQPLIQLPRTGDSKPVELGKEELAKAIAKEVRQMRPPANPEKAARDLFEVPPRSGWYRYNQREGVVPLDAPPPAAAIGQTAASFSAKAPTLPGSAQASAAGARVGVQLTEVAQVEAVAVTADAVTIALAPNAVAVTAQSVYGAASSPVDAEGPEHHIASDKFSTSTNNGGPWTPRYQELFDKAGTSLDDAANKVRVPGHKGPHPQEYHEEVFRRLRDATLECRSIQECRAALTRELQRLGRQISTPGTRLNKLVTRSP